MSTDLNTILKNKYIGMLRDIQGFFQDNLQSSGFTSVNSINSVTSSPTPRQTKDFIEQNALLCPVLLYRSIEMLAKELEKIDNQKFKQFFCIIKGHYKYNKNGQYISQFEAINALRNYYIHANTKLNKKEVPRAYYKVDGNRNVMIDIDNIDLLIGACEDIMNEVFT